MQQAYQRVRERLQIALPHYMPIGVSAPTRKHGREALPREDVKTLRAANGEVSDAVYEAVKAWVAATNADTRQQDEWALHGIQRGISAQTQARAYGVATWRMRRAVNTSGSAVKLTLEWGGTTAPDDQIEITIPAESGFSEVIPGHVLQNGKEVRAFAATANVLVVHGYVNRYENS
jgi:hypothetical protein